MLWTIDPAHSRIEFLVRHMMISKVRGVFDQFSGTVALDEENPENTSVEVQIEAASINTRDERRDAHLRSADFFDAENYPYLTFRSKDVKRLGETAARMTGDLTIRGITHAVVMDVEFNGLARSPWGTESAGFTAHTKINRKDWDLTWNQALETGGVLVGDDIEINIELELIKQPENVGVQQ
ncbi:MAG TPA: YceI family protein [Anaerolineaceae bacterium]|nr:YceI family protein [Anaerolineaceae bacterium]